MAQKFGKLLNSGKPMEIAEVDIYEFDSERGEYVPTGETLKVPSLLYFTEGKHCVVNHFESGNPAESGLHVMSVE